MITRLLKSELETRSARHWLLDGFPRTLAQAEALDRNCDVDLVVSLNIPFETLKNRLSRRWIHPSSVRSLEGSLEGSIICTSTHLKCWELMTSLASHWSNRKMINLKQLLLG